MLIACRNNRLIVNSIQKSTFKYFILTSEFCFKKIFVNCWSLVLTSVSKRYALLLWKFDIFRRFKRYTSKESEGESCHRFAELLKNYINRIWNVSFQPYRAIRPELVVFLLRRSGSRELSGTRGGKQSNHHKLRTIAVWIKVFV